MTQIPRYPQVWRRISYPGLSNRVPRPLTYMVVSPWGNYRPHGTPVPIAPDCEDCVTRCPEPSGNGRRSQGVPTTIDVEGTQRARAQTDKSSPVGISRPDMKSHGEGPRRRRQGGGHDLRDAAIWRLHLIFKSSRKILCRKMWQSCIIFAAVSTLFAIRSLEDHL